MSSTAVSPDDGFDAYLAALDAKPGAWTVGGIITPSALAAMIRFARSLRDTLTPRIDALEAIDAGTRLAALEAVNAGPRLDTLEAVDAGTRLTALEGVNAGGRLDTLEQQLAALTDRVTAAEQTEHTALVVTALPADAPEGQMLAVAGDLSGSVYVGHGTGNPLTRLLPSS